MKKIVVDSDALIKLYRAGVLEKVKLAIVISKQVYKEVVTEGKKQLYSDAFGIEKMVKEGKIRVQESLEMLDAPNLGKGEASTFCLFKTIKANAIVSDDRAFLRVLEEQNIPFIVPTEFIVAMAVEKKITATEAVQALGKIKDFVRKENYESALEALGGRK